MSRVVIAIWCIAPTLGALGGKAFARETDGKYHITSEERAACSGDAERLCSSAYPDETKLLSCMKEHRSSLTAGCSGVFAAGLKRRGL